MQRQREAFEPGDAGLNGGGSRSRAPSERQRNPPPHVAGRWLCERVARITTACSYATRPIENRPFFKYHEITMVLKMAYFL